ncbi:hypothetical protein AURDEDRAFT_173765 [Auricularia subglabra TFB-10046 SS5]|nr:hypothetical protein AURDEDRAFT_173765 [Auricularia subglabra TFB-10046 SS5]
MQQPQPFVTALLDERVIEAMRATAREQGLGEQLRQFRLIYGGTRETDAISLDSVPELEPELSLPLSSRPAGQELRHLNLTGEEPAPDFAPGYQQVVPVFLAIPEPGGVPTIIPTGSAEYERRREALRDSLEGPLGDHGRFVRDAGLCSFCGCAPHGHRECSRRDAPSSPSYAPESPRYSPVLDEGVGRYSPVESELEYAEATTTAPMALPDVGTDVPFVLDFFSSADHRRLIDMFELIDRECFGAMTNDTAIAGLAAHDVYAERPLEFEDCSWFLNVKEYQVYKLLAFELLGRRFLAATPMPHWPTLEHGFLTSEQVYSLLGDIRQLERLGDALCIMQALEGPFEQVLGELAVRRDMLHALVDAGMVWDTAHRAPVARLLRSVDGLLAADDKVCAFHAGVFVDQANDFERRFGHLERL